MKTIEHAKDGNNTLKYILVFVIFLVIAISAIAVYYLDLTNVSAQGDITIVRNVFLDVDGDGQIDLLVKGEVIFNSPLQSAPAVQP